MKRPTAVYIASVIYGIIGAILLAAAIAGQFNTDALAGFGFLWRAPVKDSVLKSAFWMVTIMFLLAAYGLFTGKKWGRNLSLLLSLLVMASTFYDIIAVFAITMRSMLTGFPALLLWVRIAIMAAASAIFYITLRPEVGWFCRVYPQDQVKAS